MVINHLACRFDDFQLPEQAGFHKGYSTIDHIHRLRPIIPKTGVYNLPLCLAFVDHKKAFDSIETWALQLSLQRCHIDYQYIEVLKYLYKNSTMSVPVQYQRSEVISLYRGVRQGDVVLQKLLTNEKEDAFKLLNWKGFGININDKCITHFRFTTTSWS